MKFLHKERHFLPLFVYIMKMHKLVAMCYYYLIYYYICRLKKLSECKTLVN